MSVRRSARTPREWSAPHGWAAVRRRALGGCAVVALLAPGGAAAQDTPAPAESGRPVLGVYLAERCPGWTLATGTCEEPPIVRAVEAGGPADRAGIHPGDTLIAIDGREIASAEGRRALGRLVEGRPVRLTLGRVEGGPRRVTVTPEVMEARSATRRLRTFARAPWPAHAPPPAGEPAAEVEIEIVEVPRFEGRIPVPPQGFESLWVYADSLHRVRVTHGAGPGRVIFLSDSAAALRIGAWAADSLRIVVGPGLGPGAGVVSSPAVAPPGAESRRAPRAAAARAAPEGTGAYVWENPELAVRLRAVRDSVERAVRVHVDSLLRLRTAAGTPFAVAPDSIRRFYLRTFGPEWETRPGARATGADALPRAGGRAGAWTGVSPGELEALLRTDARAAGAEFTPLTPGLAENFRGVERGLLVLRVLPDTPAERLGLRDGDVVVGVDGVSCGTVSQLREVLTRGVRQGRPITVKWVRKGRTMEGVLSGS